MTEIGPTTSIASAMLSGAQQFGTAALKQSLEQEQAAVQLSRQAAESDSPDGPPASSSGSNSHLVDIEV